MSETEGGFVNEYTINFPASTAYRDAAIAGFLIGRNGQEPVPGSPMRQLVVAEGPSPGVTLFLQWTNDSVRSANVRWQRPGHSVGIAVEMGS